MTYPQMIHMRVLDDCFVVLLLLLLRLVPGQPARNRYGGTGRRAYRRISAPGRCNPVGRSATSTDFDYPVGLATLHELMRRASEG